MVGWLLNLVYLGLLAVASPVLAYRMLVHGKYRAGWNEKLLGRLPRRESHCTCVWLHAVSVGEVLLLRSIVAELRRVHPVVEIWISTTTHTGHAVARDKFPGCTVVYFPLDFTWSVRSAIRRVRPDVIGLVELELWPNFIRAASAEGVPLVLVNGRIGLRSFDGYRRIRFLIRPTLRRFARLGVQTEEFRRRLMLLGACGRRTVVTGSVKFDGVETDKRNPRTAALRSALGIGPNERVLVAGSTHEPEEEIVLESYRKLRAEFADLRLVIAPRHRERFDEVAEMIGSRGLPVVKRSGANDMHTGTAEHPESAVVLLDTLGELSDCWGLADIAFVGGSLSQRGGQNMLEPCGYGAAVLTGPNTWNFRETVELLREQDAVCVVHDGAELTSSARHLLRHPDEAHQLGRRARSTVLSHQGATSRTVELLSAALIGKEPSESRRAPVRVAAKRKRAGRR